MYSLRLVLISHFLWRSSSSAFLVTSHTLDFALPWLSRWLSLSNWSSSEHVFYVDPIDENIEISLWMDLNRLVHLWFLLIARLFHIWIELPLHFLYSIWSEPSFINTNDKGTVMEKLCEETTYPESLFIIYRISILIVSSFEFLILKVKMLLQYKSYWCSWRSFNKSLRKIVLYILLEYL